MGYRALTQIMQGANPVLEPGEPIPSTFLDIAGDEQPNDFERLVELGAAEKVEPEAKPTPQAPAPNRRTAAKRDQG